MPCPNPDCKAPDEFIKKQGSTLRKKDGEDTQVMVRQYQCKKCGYKGVGRKFNLTEELGDDEEKECNDTS